MNPILFGHPVPGVAALRLFGAAALALTVLLTGQEAAAAAPCADHDKVTKELADRWSEVPVSLGLAGDGKLLQVFSTEDGATWTLVLTEPGGKSCVVASGRHWQTVTPKPRGPEA